MTRIIPLDVLQRQIDASEPDISAWVAANAGSGKTHVLMLRVIKLLLRSVDPAKILCITFTKAAAANMATRVFDELAKWTRYDDTELDAAIAHIGEIPDAATRARARQLFAIALETPGGLKVQTIHAFCARLLHQFPFEADVAARFSVLDDTMERQLLDRLQLKVMLEAAANPQSALGRALTNAVAFAADQTFKDVVRDAIGKRDEIERWIAAAGGLDAALAELSRSLGLDTADSSEAIADEFFSNSLIPASEWPALMAALAEGTDNDRKHIDRLEAVRTARGSARIEAYLAIFCTAEFAPRKSVVTKTFANKHPELAQRLNEEQRRVCALLDKSRAVECRDRSAALITIAHAVIGHYRTEKNRRGLLDYDDLIDRTLALFDKTSPSWVLYKLDAGIDHVLIDEAQDTSPKQWDIIGTIIGEFTAGAGARPRKRTLFAVGDDKQSIFSFQGAEPRRFSAMQRHFKQAFEAVKLDWRLVPLQTSFRSGATLLEAVDTVFARAEAYQGLSADPVRTVHSALADAVPGFVEIWPLVEPDDKVERDAWQAPLNAESEKSPRVQLARKIARQVRRWIGREAVGRDGRPARAGDILVLVRQRGPLFEAIIRALKHENVPVAGADRLVLTEHIAIMDLIALADALLLPQDDLALACVLRSPLFGFSDEDLYRIAWDRGARSLHGSLIGRAGDDPRFADAAARIERLTDAARRDTPFAFYARLLGSDGGRKRFLERLGHEANDALDEFLNLALAYESRETPTLQGFIAWLRAAQAEVKRDMEITRDEVRVMTVHGAKGLEAPIVVLADTTTAPAGPRPPRLLALPPSRAIPDAPPALVWAGRKDQDVPALATAREEAQQAACDEYRRLLYVAMTRAAERLIVCGVDGARQRPQGCWYDLIADALREHPDTVAIDDGDGKVHRFQKQRPPSVAIAQGAKDIGRPPVPLWLHRPAPAQSPQARVVTPSGADEDRSYLAGGGALDRKSALARGRIVHRLMQSLPDIAPERRAEAAQHHLSRAGSAFGADERAEIVSQVMSVIGDPRFAALFAPGSRAEVPIVGRLTSGHGSGVLVSGQIDRLAVTAEAVLIADYKTNRLAPRSIEELLVRHGGYVLQLALYRAVLALIYRNRPIRAALVWTDLPDLMEIPASLLDAQLATLTSA